MDETPDLPTGCSFSPCPQNPQDAIPYEVDLITVSKKNGTVNTIMPTSGLRLADIIRTPFDRGWIDIDMNNDTDSRWTSVSSDAQGTTTWTSHGWPVLGLQLVNNKNYSGARPIQALTNVTVGAGLP